MHDSRAHRLDHVWLQHDTQRHIHATHSPARAASFSIRVLLLLLLQLSFSLSSTLCFLLLAQLATSLLDLRSWPVYVSSSGVFSVSSTSSHVHTSPSQVITKAVEELSDTIVALTATEDGVSGFEKQFAVRRSSRLHKRFA